LRYSGVFHPRVEMSYFLTFSAATSPLATRRRSSATAGLSLVLMVLASPVGMV
jgi:hypothetical protein